MNASHLLRSAFLGTLLASNGALAGETIDKTLPAAADGVVAIDNLRGSIEVHGWDRPEVKVEGELDDLATELVFTRDGDRTRIEVVLPDDNIDSGDGSTLTVRVPAASRVEIRGVSSDSTINGVQGGVTLRSVSGDVTARTVAGELLLKTVSGDLDVHAGPGAAELKTVSGDLELELSGRDAEITTVSGDVRLALGEFDSLALTTVNGDLSVTGTLARRGRVECKSVSGDCTLRLSGSVDARVNVRTGPGGEIGNGLNETVPEEEFPAQQRLDTTIGDGTGTITASTVSGTVNLERE